MYYVITSHGLIWRTKYGRKSLVQFCFYSVVLANIELKCMQRALCLLRLCQIFMHILYISQITHCSTVNCWTCMRMGTEGYTSQHQSTVCCYMSCYSLCCSGKASGASTVVHWQTLLVEVHPTFVIILLFNNYLQCSGHCNVCLCWFSLARQMKPKISWDTKKNCLLPWARSLAGVVWVFFNSILINCTIIGGTEIGLKRGLSTVEVLREILLKLLSGVLFKDREFFQLLVLMFG